MSFLIGSMHRILACTILFLFLALEGYAQVDSVIVFSGKVLHKTDSTAVAGAHVINLTYKKGSLTDANGNYTLQARKGDRILFSFLGLEVDTVQVDEKAITNNQLPLRYLDEQTFDLPVFHVLSISSYEEFKRAFLALDLPEKNIRIPMPGETGYLGPVPDGAAMIRIPFDLSYFTKQAKELRKYAALLEKDRKKALIHARYNVDIIEKVTGLKDKSDAEALMDHCNFSDQFIKESVDYDLYVAIIECYEDYQEKKEKPD